MAEFDEKKQRLLIEYLISSPDTFAICQNIIKSEYFDPALRNSVTFIQTYYNKYNSLPSPDQIDAETDQQFTHKTVSPDEIKYCINEIESFCKQQGLIQAVLQSPKLIEEQNYGKLETLIKDAVLISLDTNLGVNYFEDPQARLLSMLTEGHIEPLGWNKVDELLFGGMSRGELLLFSANSGGGKSITLSNLGFNFLERGKNVLYISLELSELIISQRYDTMVTGISRKDWTSRAAEISLDVEQAGRRMGQLVIKQMESGTKSTAIRAYLKEYYLKYKHYPDLLILDYIDNMSPNENTSGDNVWLRDKLCSEQLRQVGIDHNMLVATASQLNRDAVKATTHDHSHIAGGISKINVSDVYISIKFTEAQRAQNQIMFSFQKTRNSDGVGKNVILEWVPKFLRIKDPEDPSKVALSLSSTPKKETLLGTPNGGGLSDLLQNLNS